MAREKTIQLFLMDIISERKARKRGENMVK